MIPPARHPAMERGEAASAPASRAEEAPRGRPPFAVGVVTGVVAALLVGVAALGPRIVGFPLVVRENLALQAEVDRMADRLSELEALTERLRLYDAQLQGLTSPTGSHGPVPEVPEGLVEPGLLHRYTAQGYTAHGDEGLEVFGDTADPASPSGEGVIHDGTDLLFDDPLEASHLRPASAWAAAISERMERFLDVFEAGEPDLHALVDELETLHAVRAALPNTWPAEGHLTSTYGWRRDPYQRRTKFHAGIDIANGWGTPVRAAASGTIVRSHYTTGYGNKIEIDHGYGISTAYAHLSRRRVREGQRVEAGQLIGTMGSTGRSTGPHLHFELRIDGNAHDPLPYLPR